VAALRFVLPLNYDSMFMDYDEDRIRRSAASEWLIFTRSRHSGAVERMEVTRFLEETGNEDSVFALSTTSLPLASEHFGHFSGFFAREFREFDFALGMHDAFKAALPGPDESRRERALALVAPLDSTLHRQLAYLWDKVDTLYAANDWTKVAFKDSTQKRFQALIKAVKNLRKKVSKEAPESQDLKMISSVLQGSLSRLQGTLESLKNSGDEGSGDQFDHFIDGYSRYSDPRMFFLNVNMANQVYAGLSDLLDDKEMGFGNSFYFPLALYHSRAAMGAALGTAPTFHTPYIRIDGSSNGFHLLQGIPLCRSAISLEIGEHLLPDVWLASRHNLFAHLEIPVSWLFMANVGVASEFTFNFEAKSFWPRADLVFVDALVIGLDFTGDNTKMIENDASMWIPRVSIGSRIGFDIYKFMRGTVNGVNSRRRIK
ncbi:MAG: hypothetical protein ABIW76_12720, partial [Fibrobacteria bacterium]